MRLAALKEAPYAFGSTYENERGHDEKWWRQRLAERTRFVAEIDGQAAGIVSGGDSETEGAAAVTTMWVAPRFRRRGVGDALIKAVLEWSRSAGYTQVLLWVTERNEQAEKLYERNGFARTGQVSPVRQGEDRIEYEMARRL
ncbi:MAG TPA: GNAT family N-acetyltransferase [Acetobacteraceae bacterium]|nr:GNAT family N-acetyltransferase [Acetobacteraceae bacterium]